MIDASDTQAASRNGLRKEDTDCSFFVSNPCSFRSDVQWQKKTIVIVAENEYLHDCYNIKKGIVFYKDEENRFL